jgi:LPXTG-motif cell wall-anchored protein
VAGVTAGLAKLNAWLVGAGVGALVSTMGAWWFVRRRTRASRT